MRPARRRRQPADLAARGRRPLDRARRADGGERYGACLVRLTTPRLRNGWLPVLQTRYVDALGVRYRQESFAHRSGRARLAGLVQLVVDARGASGTANRSLRGLCFRLTFSVRPGGVRTVFVAWPVGADAGRPRLIGRRVYSGARESLTRFWERRLAEGHRARGAGAASDGRAAAILVQNLGLTWRYSIGNAYEQFSFPEGVDVAQVTSSYGHEEVARSILRTSLTRKVTPVSELEDGPEARRFGASLPPLSGPDVRRGGDARRSVATSSSSAGSSPRASAGFFSGSVSRPTSPTRSTGSTRRRSPGRGCAGWGSSGPRRATRRSQRRAVVSPTASGAGFERRCANRRCGLRTAPSSFPRGCSTGNGPTTI